MLNSTKKEETDPSQHLGSYYTLIEFCFLYLHLKLLYAKFAFEAKYIKVAETYCIRVQELLVYLKKDQNGLYLKQFKKKLLVTMSKRLFRMNSHIMFADNPQLCDVIKPYVEGSEIEINVFEKFFSSCISIKATLMKYYLKLK